MSFVALRGRTAPARVSPRRASPTRRAAKPEQWVLAGEKGFPIKVATAQDRGINTSGMTVYGSQKEAMDNRNPALSRGARPKAWYYNKTTGRVSERTESNTVVGGASAFMGPYGSKAEADNAAVASGAKKTVARRGGVSGKPRNAPRGPWVRAGKVPKNGTQRSWITVGGPTYNALKGTMIDGVPLENLPQVSDADKRAEAKSSQARARASPGQKKRQGETLFAQHGVRKGGTARQYAWCLINPNTNRPIGIGEIGSGKVSGTARAIAREQGMNAKGRTATSKSQGRYVVSDQEVDSFLQGLVRNGRLKAAKVSKKCGGAAANLSPLRSV